MFRDVGCSLLVAVLKETKGKKLDSGIFLTSLSPFSLLLFCWLLSILLIRTSFPAGLSEAILPRSMGSSSSHK